MRTPRKCVRVSSMARTTGEIDVKGEGEVDAILEFLSGLSEKLKPNCAIVILERREHRNVAIWLEL